MSMGPGDDDNDKIDRLIDEIRELTELMRLAFLPTEGELEGGEDEEGPADMWREGTSVSVRTMQEFKSWRRKAATGPDVSTPYFEVDEVEGYGSTIDAHVELYKLGYQNLEELRSTLGKGGFAEFVRELVKAAGDPEMGGQELIVDELVDILEPSPAFFGIQEIEGDIQINKTLTPLVFIRAYGYTWNITAEPNEVLGLGTPSSIETIIGDMDGREMNEKLARNIDRRRGLRLPDRYENLL